MSKRTLTDAERAALYTQVVQTLATRPRGSMPLGKAAALLKKADRAGMTLETWIALFNARKD